MIRRILFAAAVIAFATPTFAADTPSAAGAKVYIIAPANGATVTGPVTVQFGLKGMGVAPAGVEMENTGHHHLIVDAATPPLTEYLPTGDAKVIHFGKGQTETELKLAPGQHTLQLVFADKDHKPHQPPVVSEKITITVK
ncbi:MAG: DUF4399 domain-containing protein [Rhodospirillaceae bacterium]|nr:DUF4399 domain-containing protein [Rhodospirillaceae bacterium]